MHICEKVKKVVGETTLEVKSLREYADKIASAKTREELEKAVKEFEKQEEKAALEIKKLKLRCDYEDQLDTFHFFGVLKEGETSYASDYAETKNERFEMPTLDEIFEWLTPEQMKLYEEMEKQGLKPRLQLRPIALNIRTLTQKIDEHKTMADQTDTHIWDVIKDSELIYEPDSYDASDPKKLKTIGGKTKGEWIRENNGWLVDIVALKQILEPDQEITKGPDGKEYTNAQKTAMYHEKLKKEGYRGLSFESYIIAQMRALKGGRSLEAPYKGFYYGTMPLDSSLQNERLVSCGEWSHDRIRLYYDGADGHDRFLRFRRSVRVKKSRAL